MGGYLIDFEAYQGKNPRANQTYKKKFDKCAAPLMKMIDELGDKKSLRYKFFFDNIFTGTNLLYTLKHNGYGATGTKSLNKDTGIIYVRWVDNSIDKPPVHVLGLNLLHL
ncbi:hypothetical protein ILUMI_06691 [Ignelater luminosus]|uniref:PiggyBac transposable element-derived protein domain-containing protein n=1 Tax=Ignelater luminosus TaxID=2038154 RepID=A0A8K0DA54_IGNLU|nr:hypothetical protein ILUMI_06691 [Ignelater luminosus]